MKPPVVFIQIYINQIRDLSKELRTQPCFFSNLNYNLDIYLNLPPTGEIMSSSFLRIFSKYREKQEKEAFMIKNGAIVLKEVIASSHGKYNPFRIFFAEELETATNNFSQLNLVKEDGYYRLYKGVLRGRSIYVMNFADEYNNNTSENFQFCINNIAFACQMRHKNVLRLIGCCIETQTPILVFESVEYGTLADHIFRHSEGFEALSWTRRLKIAMQVADAVAYLHVGFARPIVSKDIKLSNVLLDEEYTAKLFDFSVSAFILEGETHIVDVLQGTYGYVAPECVRPVVNWVRTGHYNEKSDVYGFGMVLLQLLTGQPASELGLVLRNRYETFSHYVIGSEAEQLIMEPVETHSDDLTSLSDNEDNRIDHVIGLEEQLIMEPVETHSGDLTSLSDNEDNRIDHVIGLEEQLIMEPVETHSGYLTSFSDNEDIRIDHGIGLQTDQTIMERHWRASSWDTNDDYPDRFFDMIRYKYNEDNINRIYEMIDPIIVGDGLCPQKEQQLKAFTELALKCVSEAAQDRPTIVDVAKQLRQMYVASM